MQRLNSRHNVNVKNMFCELFEHSLRMCVYDSGNHALRILNHLALMSSQTASRPSKTVAPAQTGEWITLLVMQQAASGHSAAVKMMQQQ